MLPGLGDAIGVFVKNGKKACKIITAFHKLGAAGNMALGAYTLGTTAKKYIDGTAGFFWKEIKGDLFTVAMTRASMLGSAKDFGTSYCFVAGTLVTTKDGFKLIEEIEVGDKVLSENEFTGEVAIKKVTQTYINETNELVHIHVNGETISVTPTHPFYVNKFGWTLAGSLKAGDVLVLSNGELVNVEWVQHEILESPIKVYNFEVEDYHTYFVGENSVFVHNGCGDDFDTWLNKGDSDNNVYFGRIDEDYKYTGITKQSKEARLQQHNYSPSSKSKSQHVSKNFDDLDIQVSGLTRNQARAIEQYYIEHGPSELNKINSISSNHRHYDKAMEWAEKYIIDNGLMRF